MIIAGAEFASVITIRFETDRLGTVALLANEAVVAKDRLIVTYPFTNREKLLASATDADLVLVAVAEFAFVVAFLA